jgi:hypothetical protein
MGSSKAGKVFLITLVTLAVAAIGAVCLHSLEEIHYLKSFFPRSFTVQEAFYASALELIKVIIIALPLLLILAVSLFFLRQGDSKKPESRNPGETPRKGT